MIKAAWGVALVGALAVTAHADNFHHVESSNGVFAVFEGTSADGCVHTSGVFFTQTVKGGALARVVASSEDTCEGTFGTHVGESSVTYRSNGLSSATVSGTVEAIDYQAQIAPLTFELSLAFTGTGPAIVQNNHGTLVSPGGNVTLSFSNSRRRNATVSGAMTVDGGAVSLTGAFIGSGTSGDISIAH